MYKCKTCPDNKKDIPRTKIHIQDIPLFPISKKNLNKKIPWYIEIKLKLKEMAMQDICLYISESPLLVGDEIGFLFHDH